MNRRLVTLLFLLLPALAGATGDGGHLDKANIDLTNKHSLQKGAKLFVNYCLSCHAAAYQRYNRMGSDLGLTEQQVIDNLMFAAQKIGEPMTVAMSRQNGKNWFGAPPPDLTLVSRSRGPDWLYTYLRTFYLDESRPFGVNNLVFPSVGMPHVLWELQGWQKPVYKTVEHEGKERQIIDHLELVEPGTMTPAEYDKAITDLVNFMTYMGEPVKLERQALGIKVLLFLLVLLVITYLLKKEYWKDVH
jgi:ubiquinol-cytochrome c reductase cytochrome c1 subunit